MTNVRKVLVAGIFAGFCFGAGVGYLTGWHFSRPLLSEEIPLYITGSHNGVTFYEGSPPQS